MEKTEVEEYAFEIFLKKMPTTFLAGENEKGFRSAIEQSVEIAQLYVKTKNEILKKDKE
jgi:hypothetical protein